LVSLGFIAAWSDAASAVSKGSFVTPLPAAREKL
jgi:hypothetical protein